MLIAEMKTITKLILLFGAVPILASQPEFNAVMMWNTFEIVSPSGSSMGTGFLVSKTIPPKDERRLKVLVTADHVFSSNSLDTVVVVSRVKATNEAWDIHRTSIRIRDGEKRLWHKSAEADIAAIYCPVPDPPANLGFELLAEDDFLSGQEIHPGDSVFVLGYPLGLSGNHGFPILRTGVISSYPLTPADRYPTIDIAFTVFPGNSGGPVYIYEANRTVKGETKLGVRIQSVLGVVIGSKDTVQSYETKRATLSGEVVEKGTVRTRLDVAVVVQASVVRRLVENMPLP